MEKEQNFLPIVKDDKVYKSSAVDVMMASKMTKEELIKTHAVEQTIQLLKGRQMASVELFNKVYEQIYEKLKNNGESTN